MVRWIKNNAHVSGDPYCGTGQSGGSSALAYTVTHYNAETVWDSLVLSGGPPHADLAFGCSEDPPCDVSGSQSSGCQDRTTECGIDQSYGNTDLICDKTDLSGSFGPCQVDPLLDGDPPGEPDWRDEAHDHSVSVSTSNDYLYGFAVHFLYGNEDNGAAPAQGVKFHDTLDNAGTETTCQVIGEDGIDFISHNIANHEEGAQAIYGLLSKYCVKPPPIASEPGDCNDITPVP